MIILWAYAKYSSAVNNKNKSVIIIIIFNLFIHILFHEADPEGMAEKFNNDNITDKVSNAENTEHFVM